MMIELQEVTKLYRTVIGVNDITLSLGSGAFGLLGPNGSGKTTLINLIMGQLRPTMGTVRLFGHDPWKNSRLFRDVGLCPANEVNLPQTTAWEWVSFLVQLHGYSRAESQKLALKALEFVRLEHAMHRPMRDYSLGMRQRAKLAQAIAHQPQLLILDEPFNGLDPVARYEMTQFLKEWGQQGRSVLLASHILHEVEAIHPSFLLISSGRLLASGSPQDVRAILADSPNQLRIRVSEPRRLASHLLTLPTVESIKVLDGQQLLEISCLSPASLWSELPRLCQELDVTIFEMHSQDESLKELFGTLMRFHRGETRLQTRSGNEASALPANLLPGGNPR